MRVPGWVGYILALLFMAGVGYAVISRLMQPVVPLDCTTPCGMRVYGFKDCATVAAAEARATIELGVVKPWTAVSICRAVNGAALRVYPVDGGTGVWSDGREAAGRTFDAQGVISVLSADFRTNAYCHELAHLLEGRLDGRFPPAEHGDWTERGIWLAIESCRRLP